jgi:hypothetical protein
MRAERHASAAGDGWARFLAAAKVVTHVAVRSQTLAVFSYPNAASRAAGASPPKTDLGSLRGKTAHSANRYRGCASIIDGDRQKILSPQRRRTS